MRRTLREILRATTAFSSFCASDYKFEPLRPVNPTTSSKEGVTLIDCNLSNNLFGIYGSAGTLNIIDSVFENNWQHIELDRADNIKVHNSQFL